MSRNLQVGIYVPKLKDLSWSWNREYKKNGFELSLAIKSFKPFRSRWSLNSMGCATHTEGRADEHCTGIIRPFFNGHVNTIHVWLKALGVNCQIIIKFISIHIITLRRSHMYQNPNWGWGPSNHDPHVPVKQSWRIWINNSGESTKSWNENTAKQAKNDDTECTFYGIYCKNILVIEPRMNQCRSLACTSIFGIIDVYIGRYQKSIRRIYQLVDGLP